jgi:UTP--glucose-1-phosphate uridylyltransferase
MKAVIPAAGLGTRFLPITKAQPKEMLPVFNKPTIQYVVEEIVQSGIDDILIITGKNKRAIEDHFDRSLELEMSLKNHEKEEFLKEVEKLSAVDIHYIRQKEQRGLGDAIYAAKKYVGNEPFAVLLGDTISFDKTPCTKQMINVFEEVKAPVIAVEKVPKEKISNYGIISFEKVGDGLLRIKDLVEKPDPEEAPSNYGIIGRYILTPEIFKMIEETKPGKGGEIHMSLREKDMTLGT